MADSPQISGGMMSVQAHTTRKIEITASPDYWQHLAERSKDCAAGNVRRTEPADAYCFLTQTGGDCIVKFRVDRKTGQHG